jgi:hypothetical protein
MPFERVMSDLTAAIGNVERLDWMTAEEYHRMSNQIVRLMVAAQNVRYSYEGLKRIQEEAA